MEPLSSSPDFPGSIEPGGVAGTEALLAQAPWVRRLARVLVTGRDVARDVAVDADDVAQQTWLQVLRSPRSAHNARGWLRVVTQRVARHFARDDAARRQREQAAAPKEAQPSFDDAVARAELHAKVVAAVLALAEPYRSTLIRRFFDELTPTQIAEREGIPVETVKTRLKRGISQVKARLETDLGVGGSGGERRSLAALLLPLTGVVTMTAAAKLGVSAAAAAIVGLATWGMWPVFSMPANPRNEVAALTEPRRPAVEIASAPERTEQAAAEIAAASDASADPALDLLPPPHQIAIEGVVTTSEGAPVSGALVVVGPSNSEPFLRFSTLICWSLTNGLQRSEVDGSFLGARCVVSDAEGRFRFEDVEAFQRSSVAAIHAVEGLGIVPVMAIDRARSKVTVDVPLTASQVLHGRVVDLEGRGVPEAGVTVVSPLSISNTSAAEDGSFRLLMSPFAPRGPILKVRGVRGFETSEWLLLDLDLIGASDREILLKIRPDSKQMFVGAILVAGNPQASFAEAMQKQLTGEEYVIGARGAANVVGYSSDPPSAGDHVTLAGAEGQVDLSTSSNRYTLPWKERTRFLALVVRECVLAVAEVGEERQLEGHDVIGPDLVADLSLMPAAPFAPTAPTTGTLLVTLRATTSEDPPFPDPVELGLEFWRKERAFDVTTKQYAIAGMQRTMPIPGVPVGECRLILRGKGLMPVARTTSIHPGFEPSNRVELPLIPADARLRGVVVSSDGTPILNAKISLFSRQEGRWEALPFVPLDPNADGLFVFDTLATGHYLVLASTDGLAPATVEVDVTASSDATIQRIVLRAGVAVHFRLLDGPFAADRTFFQMTIRDSAGAPIWQDAGPGWGPWQIGTEATLILPAGMLTLEAQPFGCELFQTTFRAAAGAEVVIPQVPVPR